MKLTGIKSEMKIKINKSEKFDRDFGLNPNLHLTLNASQSHNR